jgi:hypothetical protein
MALRFQKPGRLALIEPARDPFGLFAFEAVAMQEIYRAVECQQDAPKRIELTRELGTEGERMRGYAPFVAGEETLLRHGVADELRSFGGGISARGFGWFKGLSLHDKEQTMVSRFGQFRSGTGRRQGGEDGVKAQEALDFPTLEVQLKMNI